VLSVKDLVKVYGDTLALDHVTFGVGRGEVVGFLGPNGAGKTTTMRIVTGFIPPTSGEARVDGLDVFRDSLAVRRLIGYLPENVPMYPDMRVSEYLRFRAQLKGVPRRDRRAQIAALSERVQIREVEGQLIGTLSKGFRQRVGLADALIGSPKLLVLDEPTAGMDPNQVRHVRKIIKELGDSHTILLSTHILREVEATCTRVVIIDRGRIVHERSLDEKSPGALEVELIGPEGEAAAKLGGLPGVRAVQSRSLGGGIFAFRLKADPGRDLREPVGRLALECGWVVREMHPVAQSLEDIFVRYTAGEASDEAARTLGPPAAGRKEV